MQCAVVMDTGLPLKVVMKDKPPIPPGGMLVKTSYAGICHSDLHIYRDPDTGVMKQRRDIIKATGHYKGSLVLGHEISGVVEQMGSDVPASCSIKVGDKVMVYPWRGCFNCPACIGGETNVCEYNKIGTESIGVGRNSGGYSSYVPVPEWELAVKVPENIPMDMASMLPCSALTAWGGLNKVDPAIERAIRLRQKANLLVIGAGGLGAWCVSLAKKRFQEDPVEIICADINEGRLANARELGADQTIFWNRDATVEELISALTASGSKKIDAAIDFVGTESTLKAGFNSLHKGSTLVVIGKAGSNFEAPITTLIGRSISVQGSRTGGLPEMKRMVEFISKHNIKCPPVVYYKIGDVNEALDKLYEGKIPGRALLKFVQ